jgi:hypothetical protein
VKRKLFFGQRNPFLGWIFVAQSTFVMGTFLVEYSNQLVGDILEPLILRKYIKNLRVIVIMNQILHGCFMMLWSIV